ncbi:MAG TPA: hypothetical protein VI432_02615, partial [Candidatus Paceibacterota bacterium]
MDHQFKIGYKLIIGGLLTLSLILGGLLWLTLQELQTIETQDEQPLYLRAEEGVAVTEYII